MSFEENGRFGLSLKGLYYFSIKERLILAEFITTEFIGRV